jgi:hypothetical protein
MSYLLLSYSGAKPLQKWIASALLLTLALYFIISRGQYTLIDNADLIIHEAGHFFFGFLGSFIHAAGGTLMQILFPLFLAGYFFRSGYRAGVQVFLFWLGQNLVNISVYAADARVRKLHLLGNGKHDWYYMLGQLNLLAQAELVGYLFFSLAIIALVMAIILPLYLDE